MKKNFRPLINPLPRSPKKDGVGVRCDDDDEVATLLTWNRIGSYI